MLNEITRHYGRAAAAAHKVVQAKEAEGIKAVVDRQLRGVRSTAVPTMQAAAELHVQRHVCLLRRRLYWPWPRTQSLAEPLTDTRT